ncbi:MAG: hypothetical protein KDJ65_27820, partial [Anaerolineae bacterium]|nr:hypothetical protein [Anaerolineae bacterium]
MNLNNLKRLFWLLLVIGLNIIFISSAAAGGPREAFEIESEGVEVGEMWRIENNWATTTELAYHF